MHNLTASGSATATNADSPYGTQGSGLISSTLDYAIVQSATFSTNTTLTVQVPEGCTIPTSGGVSAVAYSAQRNPLWFSRTKGQVALNLYGENPSLKWWKRITWYLVKYWLQTVLLANRFLVLGFNAAILLLQDRYKR